MCIRCNTMLDLDWCSDEVIYINNEAVCSSCSTEEEVETFEKECEKEYQRKKEQRQLTEAIK